MKEAHCRLLILAGLRIPIVFRIVPKRASGSVCVVTESSASRHGAVAVVVIRKTFYPPQEVK